MHVMSRSKVDNAFLVLFCLLAAASLINGFAAFIEDKRELDNGEDVEVVVRQLYQSTVRRFRRPIARDGISTDVAAGDNGDCQCDKNSCGCCSRLSIPKLHIDETACVNVTFLSKQLGVKVSITLNGREIYSKVVSVSDPQPMCFQLTSLAKACFYLYNLAYTDRALKGCSKADVKSFGKKIAEINFGCFSIPLLDADAADGLPPMDDPAILLVPLSSWLVDGPEASQISTKTNDVLTSEQQQQQHL